MDINDVVELLTFFFFVKKKTAYEIASCLVGSEMCIRDRTTGVSKGGKVRNIPLLQGVRKQRMRTSIGQMRPA